MDIRIRGDLDGIETARILRDRFDVPIVYLTAHADHTTVGRASTTEPYGYLVKPIAPHTLSTTVEVAFHKHEIDRKLRERERWFATILRSIGDAVISTDQAGHVTYLNPVAEKLTDCRAEDAVGRPVAEIVPL